ncbi:sirohydrochlorin chelatase [Metabacillus iocasae]|uniref:Sirohydrochlorin ferrochelatase n=1 Tax=Priestia iocasae TaxID=2291674 RepID=A0ABS2QYU6_9BACI|nr:sirohydrochlorin chelatase [Metabacillus iocasae]MBM7704666.1 sirohydrochlorin ferrochelatase [Metabacillus iocasae]
MDAVLYICHGSRVKEGCREALSFVQRCKEKVSIPIQEAAFLELAEPTIEEAFERCVEQGATRIMAIPILLLTAAHAKQDIPNVLKKMIMRYPHVELSYGQPFGVQEKIIDILLEKVKDTNQEVTDQAMALLVGRGSSDQEALMQFQEIAQQLEERSKFQRVNTCFLAAATPTFKEGLLNATTLHYRQVFVIPYLLFTGVLMSEVIEEVKKLSSSSQQIILTNYLGYHSNLIDLLVEQVHQLHSSLVK